MPAPHLTPPGPDREELRIVAVCPMCQMSHYPLASREMAQRGDSHLLYFECRQCGSAVVAFVTADANGVDSIGMMTDVTSEELLDTVDRPAVNPDDVLDLYQWALTHDPIQLTLRREKEQP